MEKTPGFIRDFSKENSQTERDLKAKEIKQTRAQYFETKDVHRHKQENLQMEVQGLNSEVENNLEKIEILKQELSELSSSGLTKLMNYFEIRQKRADIIADEEKQETLIMAKNKSESAFNDAQKNTNDSAENKEHLKKAEKLLSNFYESEKKKWENSNYDKEDIKKYFSENHLASLSVEDYALLMKRFSGEMITHVTRQGVRDHVGHMYHTSGEGEHFNGFKTMIKDGKLRSPLGVYMNEKEKDKAIAKMLDLKEFSNKEEAIEYLNIITESEKSLPGGYADKNAIHFATEEVADCYYGSEKDNEIFIAYPSAFIASQYYFAGQLNEAGGGYWNDQFVWDMEQDGMDLNAGLVFIPEGTKVDKETGSRYQLDENNNPIKNIDYHSSFKQVVNSDDFSEFAEEVMKVGSKLNFRAIDFQSMDADTNKSFFDTLKPLCNKIEEEFNIKDKKLQLTILNPHLLLSLVSEKNSEAEGRRDFLHNTDSLIEKSLQSSGILLKETDNPVKSKDYWENYFSQNPKSKPSKVIYYQGGDPTKALLNWREKVGINKTNKEKNIGFPERNVENDSGVALKNRGSFKSLAVKVINDYYKEGV